MHHSNKKVLANKIKLLRAEGKAPKQAVAMALSMAKTGKLKKTKSNSKPQLPKRGQRAGKK